MTSGAVERFRQLGRRSFERMQDKKLSDLIDATIRDEIEQSPAWWDREFRALSQKAFRTKPFVPEEHEGHNAVSVMTFGGHGYEFCTECPTEEEPRPARG